MTETQIECKERVPGDLNRIKRILRHMIDEEKCSCIKNLNFLDEKILKYYKKDTHEMFGELMQEKYKTGGNNS